MTDPMKPADVYRHSLRLLLEKDMDGWVSLCDEHVVIDFPYATADFPAKLEGRAAVAAYMRGYPDHIDLREIPSLEIHETGDPEKIIAEWQGNGRIVATDTPYEMPYVAVVTVKNGLITHYRDYWSPSSIPGSPNDITFFSDERQGHTHV
ncbi:nuclear transport factor 2 family protein [Streptomyces sp. NBC_01317]|uniref:nuclear transport factor 2 family protein n=1 Tax=Streptomyces sp. NBC_01317 TaxID=2903822 RepID=UPI002E16192B|nr:nuclear transport factor 2 family protein [Streptomyces sp. NBC_01317]